MVHKYSNGDRQSDWYRCPASSVAAGAVFGLTLKVNPDKVGGYSPSFKCPRCEKIVDARWSEKQGEFFITTHYLPRKRAEKYGIIVDNLAEKGSRERRAEKPAAEPPQREPWYLRLAHALGF